ncbi:MAG TPA: alcohol dehydrogenase catalytic domain-containing protein [Actinocrinis sp.]|nr:alcohol dehydrogenase catalytic domain-containing protein [Actinocrinis sp.]
MLATLLYAAGDIRVQTVPDPKLQEPSDVVVRVTHSCICGSDLWPYKSAPEIPNGRRIGHEFIGVIEEAGSETGDLRAGQWVIAPFMFSDGTCANCRHGIQPSCLHGGGWGATQPSGHLVDGGQGEYIRVPMATGTLVAIPEGTGQELAPALLSLSDVMSTGHHAALSARVAPGGTVAVVGDGAVGLCGVLAARRLGAERIIVLGSNPARWEVARRFGATDQISVRGAQAVGAALRELTGGVGADSVLECVGTREAFDTAVAAARPGGAIGYVGVPQDLTDGYAPLPIRKLFADNITVGGGIAPVRAYLPELLAEVLDGRLDPSPVFDLELPLAQAADGYRAMNDRTAIKVLLKP